MEHKGGILCRCAGSDEHVPPWPKRRNQQPAPPLSTSLLEQVPLATSLHYFCSSIFNHYPFSNPENFSNAHLHTHTQLLFVSRSRVPVDSTNNTTTTSSSSEKSLRQTSLDSTSTTGQPPPTHPIPKPHHLQYQYQPPQNSHTRSWSYPYSNPFAGSHLDQGAPQKNGTNVDDLLLSTTISSFTQYFSPATTATPSIFHSRSLHQASPPIPACSLFIGNVRKAFKFCE